VPHLRRDVFLNDRIIVHECNGETGIWLAPIAGAILAGGLARVFFERDPIETEIIEQRRVTSP
jgi:hypothetical protein